MKITSSVCNGCGVLLNKPAGSSILYQASGDVETIMEFCAECYAEERIRYTKMTNKTLENMTDELRAKVEASA